MDFHVKLASLHLPNPIGVASGTFGYGEEMKDLCNFQHIGAIYTKAITLAPRAGNKPQRLAETPSGLLNSIGLANVGLDEFVQNKLAFFQSVPSACIVNVAGSTEDDYIQLVSALEEYNDVDAYEINLSCPNVKAGCLAFGTDPHHVERLSKTLAALTKKPLIIKLTPNVTSIESIAKAAEQGGATAVSCINTLVGMKINIHEKRAVLSPKTGGLSGPAIRPVALAAVYKVAKAVKIPVIGIGGISTGEDAVEFLLAGASAIQLGTVNFTNPAASSEIYAFILDYAKKHHLKSIQDFHQFDI